MSSDWLRFCGEEMPQLATICYIRQWEEFLVQSCNKAMMSMKGKWIRLVKKWGGKPSELLLRVRFETGLRPSQFEGKLYLFRVPPGGLSTPMSSN